MVMECTNWFYNIQKAQYNRLNNVTPHVQDIRNSSTGQTVLIFLINLFIVISKIISETYPNKESKSLYAYI